MYKLDCGVQKYSWGRKGNDSKVAVYKQAQDESFQLNDVQAYAELWMGTHSNCPSKIEITKHEPVLLSDYIKQNANQALGASVNSHFYSSNNANGDLPFLFKVLSINQALSIQAHPTKKLAAELHAKDAQNYPDSNHKPEMLIAISDEFEAMCGFRLAAEISSHFESTPELVELCGQLNCAEFNRAQSESALRVCFSSMMSQSESVVVEQFAKLKARLEARAERGYLDDLYLRLAEQYVNDVGCFSIYLLNCLKLSKGEAIFLAANMPHAYLFGDGVECMACSDNVVRAGLTPKFKDVEVLCEMLDYRMRSAEDNKLVACRTGLSAGLSYLEEFRPSVDEFSVQEIRVSKADLVGAQKKTGDGFLFKLSVPKCESGSILIVNESAQVKSYFSCDGSSKLEAKCGLVYFVDANVEFSFVVEADLAGLKDGELVLLAYRAYTDIKH